MLFILSFPTFFIIFTLKKDGIQLKKIDSRIFPGVIPGGSNPNRGFSVGVQSIVKFYYILLTI